MPSVLKRIEDALNGMAPAWTTTHVVPRGVPRFVDSMLRGTLKNSRRIGDFVPNIQPQNSVTLVADISAGTNLVPVDSLLSGYQPGSLVRIANQEVILVADVSTETKVLMLADDLIVAHAAGSAVDLFAQPIRFLGPFTPGKSVLVAGAMEFQVQSERRVLRGDQLFIQSDPDLLLGGTNFTVAQSIQLPMSGNQFRAQITLDEPTPRDLALNDILFLRSFPGYYSPVVPIPNHRRSPVSSGPFVVDYISGRFDDGDLIEEALDLQLFDAIGTPMLGSGVSFVPAEKNTVVTAVPIDASSFLFWDVVRGSVNWQAGQFRLRTDSNGRAVLNTELVPAWAGPQTWTCQAEGVNAVNGTVYYRFWPNAEATAGPIIIGSPTTLTFTLGAMDQPATRLELTFVGPPDTELKWTSWLPSGPTATRLQYTLVGRVEGNNTWQAGSLMTKPYFSVLGDIAASFDFDSFDSGSVML